MTIPSSEHEFFAAPRPVRRRHAVRLLAAAGAAAVLPSRGADWRPVRPIRMVVPYAPGGTTDLIGRIVAGPLGRELGQEVVVDNRGGGGGTIGMGAVAQAAADGYTIGMPALGAHASNETLMAKLPYDSDRDFQPLAYIGQSPLVVVAAPNNPARTLPELMARAKSAGKGINFASGGIGLGAHIAGELLKLRSGADMTHVAYKGGGPAMTDVMAGQVDMLFAPIGTVLPLVRAGKLKALAIASAARSPRMPEVPTMQEAGFPDFVMAESFGLLAPRGLPPEVAQRLQQAAATVLRQPEVARRMDEQGVDLAPAGPQQLDEFIRSEVRKYRDVIQRAGIKPS